MSYENQLIEKYRAPAHTLANGSLKYICNRNCKNFKHYFIVLTYQLKQLSYIRNAINVTGYEWPSLVNIDAIYFERVSSFEMCLKLLREDRSIGATPSRRI